tara:strand:- start:381 stop:908 length:528 start_codon:yes stop_codon:yes gene_type:complete
MDSIRNKKYIYIPNFFSKNELKILQPYCKNVVSKGVVHDPQSPFTPSYYKDPLMDSLLIYKKPLVEKVSKLKLYETYAYWRYYIHGSTLKDHTDRPSCEISISACINNCGIKWPMHFNKKWLNMKIGDAVMYLGCEVLHGRKPFKGIENPQVFFHYVDQNGPYKDHKGDCKLNEI